MPKTKNISLFFNKKKPCWNEYLYANTSSLFMLSKFLTEFFPFFNISRAATFPADNIYSGRYGTCKTVDNILKVNSFSDEYVLCITVHEATTKTKEAKNVSELVERENTLLSCL